MEALVDDHWYVATVVEVFANGEYRVEYADDENVDFVDKDEVRPYQPYEESGGDEVVECKLEPDENESDHDEDEDEEDCYEKCRVLYRDEDGFFQVVLEESGEFFDDAEIAILRRFAD